MNYTITESGIVYHVTPEHVAEEQETDAIEDAQQREMTLAEALKTLSRISAEIEARDNVQPTQ